VQTEHEDSEGPKDRCAHAPLNIQEAGHCRDGHFTDPYEQKTQQSRFVDPQWIEPLVAWPAAPFFMPVWLSLFSSGVSMWADTGRFAQASSQDN
jgi:hypothetical protein